MQEFTLLRHVYESNPSLPAHVLIPPGDDMAMVQFGAERLLVAADQVVDGRHVRIGVTPIELVGRKAITRCASDVAAMAAVPCASLATVTVPPDFDEDLCRRLFDAMRRTADSCGCPLVGGDIAVHAEDDALVCSVSIVAGPGPVTPTRAGARAGDAVYVTGVLGGACDSPTEGHHLTFTPRIAEAALVAGRLGGRLHAMIDLSDGLGRDAGHVAAGSEVQIILEADRIPARGGLAWQRAVADGEDYELCFTAVGEVPDRAGDTPITRVGEVVEAGRFGPDGVYVRTGDELVPVGESGWQHGS